MTYVIRVDATMQGSWDAYVSSHPEAAPYHRFAWLTAIERAYGFTPVPLMAVSDSRVVGIFPLVKLKQPGLPAWLISLPYCDFSGQLADDEEIERLLLARALLVARGQGAAGVEIRREDPCTQQTPKVLMRLSLPQGAQQLMDCFPAKLRSQVKKPLRDGLRVSWGGENLLDTFYRVFTRNMLDMGSPTHSLDWFQEVVRGYGDRAWVTVVSLPDGTPSAAAITLTEGQWAFVPWASSLKEHKRQNANMLLYWSMLSRAADAGLKGFDFGRSTPGQGTHRFKSQWGAKQQGLVWTRQHLVLNEQESVLTTRNNQRLRPLAEACWRCLPLGVANWAGPTLRRYISL